MWSKATRPAACCRVWKPDEGGSDGQGDRRIQAYCYRMCLTDAPDNRVRVGKPEGYDEHEFELLFRAIEQGQKKFFKLSMVPRIDVVLRDKPVRQQSTGEKTMA